MPATASVHRIALLRTSRRRYFFRVIVPEFVHVRIHVAMSARTRMRRIALLRTSRRRYFFRVIVRVFFASGQAKDKTERTYYTN